MNTKRFWATVALMSFALTGLILLQTYWIRHDIQLKEQQFGNSVMQAMNAVVDQVEQKENMKIVVKKFLSTSDSGMVDFSGSDTSDEALNDFLQEPPPPPPPVPPMDVKDFSDEVNLQIEKLREIQRHRNPDGELRLGTDTSTIDVKVEKDVQTKEIFDLSLAKEEARFDSLARETERRVSSRMRRLNTMMQQFTFQIGDRNSSIFNRIDSVLLDSIIHSELLNLKIDQPYTFGISNPEKAELIFAKSKSDSFAIINSPYHLPLFPNDFFKRNEQLILSFPSKINYLLFAMWPLLASSLVFTLIMILGFVYTLKVILKQKKLAEIKNDFINNMTHEFKTPIATIAIATESIRDPRVYGNYEKLDYYTTVIKDENQRMLGQVENVLQMAQIDKGELMLKKSEVDIHDILNNAAGSSFLSVKQREGNIELELSAEQFNVFADPNHFLNVFINLIDNANKYSPDSPIIHVKSWNEADFIFISVSDKGIGMTKEIQKRIFETFYRATKGNIHDVKGFGLGLSYVKAIVEAHEGSISVNSEPGKGSTFTISLPLYKR